MKTKKLLMLITGFFLISSVFSFTVVNLPIDELSDPLPNNELSFDNPDLVSEVIKPDNTQVKSKYLKDTILIDLAKEAATDPFPSASKNCILQQVPYPEFARAKQIEGGVAVRFAFDANGDVHVKEAFSNSSELEDYVINKLSNLQLKNCVVDVNKDYYLRFMFRMF